MKNSFHLEILEIMCLFFRFDNNMVLGYRIELTWYKDHRKARLQGKVKFKYIQWQCICDVPVSNLYGNVTRHRD